MPKKWIRLIFRCNYCGADHVFPKRGRWTKSEDANKFLKEHLTMCPGCVDLMLPPHIEIFDTETGDIIRHNEHFNVLKEVEKPN